jgi:hypothetical protein
MPTKHRRRAVTETPKVRVALDRLECQLKDDRIDLGELLVLGAEAKLAALRAAEDRGTAARKRLADRIRSRQLNVDLEAAEEVRRTGWVRQ